VSLALAELGLRAFGVGYVVRGQPDRVTGWAHIPGAHGWYTGEGRGYVRINSAGWRGPERPITKPSGVTRIAVLGDSYTEATQVEEDSAFPALLERRLNDSLPGHFEVLNFGVSGFGTGQELLTLQHYAFAYAPDAVVLAFMTGNDISDNSPTLKPYKDFPYFTLTDGRLVLDTSFLASPRYRASIRWPARAVRFAVVHCRLAQLVGRALQSVEAARALRMAEPQLAAHRELPRELIAQWQMYLDPPPDTAWDHAWSVTEALLARINAECRARHIPFYLVTLSNPPQVTPDTAKLRSFAAALGVRDLFHPERRLAQLSAREGIAMLALAPLFSADAVARHEYYHGFGKYPGRGHWNGRGHALAADLIGAWLTSRLPQDLRDSPQGFNLTKLPPATPR